jgi:hypothetical protein
MSSANSRAAYMREYRKRKRLEEGNCNNVPKRTKLHADGNSRAAYMREYRKRKSPAERRREYRKAHKNLFAEYMRNYRKRKAQEKGQEEKTTRICVKLPYSNSNYT